jgi:hypothetical protein
MAQDNRSALDAFYRRAVELADQARGWFDGPGVEWRAGLPVDAQAAVAVESLGTTARLIAVMSWLLDPAQGAARPPAFAPSVDPDLPTDSPLTGTIGGEIAMASRGLAAEIAALAGRAAA